MSETATTICPEGSSNAQSDLDGDHGDFGNNRTPTYTSQKNLVKVGYDPRTNTLLALRGMHGGFGEDPSTNPNMIRSKDCGETWTQVSDLVADGVITRYMEGGQIEELFHIPMLIVPGLNPGEWIIMDFVGRYYISTDDGATWSAPIEGGIGLDTSGFFPSYTGTLGLTGQLDTRTNSLWHYTEEAQLGYAYLFPPPDGSIELVGFRRSIGPNGTGGWEDTIAPSSDWEWMGAHPVLHGANGRWIAIVDRDSIAFTSADGHIRVNTSPDLDPNAWSTPFHMIDEPYLTDIYQGQADHITSSLRMFRFRQGHPKLKFVPQDGHPVGGRWWFMGVNDCLLYSDDNGDTWSNSLSDHREPEAAMHPILNWRSSHDYTTRATRARILDMFHDPLNQGRLISIGVTYDRPGITNRLAVFCCSDDGGDTWGAVGQLPISLENIQSTGTSAGFDSPAVARYIFPCMGGVS